MSEKKSKAIRRSLKNVTMTKAARRLAKRHPQTWHREVRRISLPGGKTVITTLRELADLRGRIHQTQMHQVFHKHQECLFARRLFAFFFIPPALMAAGLILLWTLAVYATLLLKGL